MSTIDETKVKITSKETVTSITGSDKVFANIGGSLKQATVNSILDLSISPLFHGYSTEADFNNITDIGCYMTNPNTTTKNTPPNTSGKYGLLEVLRCQKGIGIIYQRWTMLTYGVTWIRTLNAGTWGIWRSPNMYFGYTATNLNSNIINNNIKIFVNNCECKLNGYIQISAGTHTSGINLFTLPEIAKPSYAVYMLHSASDSSSNSALRIDTDGTVYLNGTLTLETSKYVYFSGSYNL